MEKDGLWETKNLIGTPIKSSHREKTVSVYNLKLNDDGIIRGSIQYTYSGYDAVNQRKQINKFRNQQAYVDDLINKLSDVSLKKYELDNPEDLKKIRGIKNGS
jgi:hypothetical protein